MLDNLQMTVDEPPASTPVKLADVFPLRENVSYSHFWTINLSRVPCSFVVAPENTKTHQVQVNTGVLLRQFLQLIVNFQLSGS